MIRRQAFAQATTLSLALAMSACGTTPPPRPLVDARAAYKQAKGGKAAQYTPADLHDAKVALNAAEVAFEDDPESQETFALSYVALRTTQLVESKANTKADEATLQHTAGRLSMGRPQASLDAELPHFTVSAVCPKILPA